jgi:hypothetical protein
MTHYSFGSLSWIDLVTRQKLGISNLYIGRVFLGKITVFRVEIHTSAGRASLVGTNTQTT